MFRCYLLAFLCQGQDPAVQFLIIFLKVEEFVHRLLHLTVLGNAGLFIELIQSLFQVFGRGSLQFPFFLKRFQIRVQSLFAFFQLIFPGLQIRILHFVINILVRRLFHRADVRNDQTQQRIE